MMELVLLGCFVVVWWRSLTVLFDNEIFCS
jgi:hypothetical protein